MASLSRLGELLMKPRAPDEADGGLLPPQHAQPGQLLKVVVGVELLGALMHGSGRQEHICHLSGRAGGLTSRLSAPSGEVPLLPLCRLTSP